jgi:hypothetical protein
VYVCVCVCIHKQYDDFDDRKDRKILIHYMSKVVGVQSLIMVIQASSREVNVGFLVNKVEMGRFSLRTSIFSHPPLFH